MPPEHLYYQEINSKDGNYYRRWASVFGPSMSELIDRILKSPKHEEQAFNACAGILHRVKAIPKGIAEAFENQLMNPNSGLESFETRFSETINHEWSGRENKK